MMSRNHFYFSVAAALLIATPTAFGAANLNDAVVLWNFDSLNDANGLNSSFTIVDEADGATGTTNINVDGGGFWAGEGPGSDDRFSNLQTGTDRAGTYFDAGQGAANELQITGAHTFLWRGEFKDTSITGYLWSKYDHNTGPGGVKSRTTYLRYNPGGDLDYVVDDGDGGLSGVTISLPDGTVGTGGAKYEVIGVFDPTSDLASIYVLNPATRAVLASNSAAVTFDTLADMDHAVPFTLGDRVAWNGSDWDSIGASGARVDVEMFAAWDQAFSQQDLIDLTNIPEPASMALVLLGVGAMAFRRRYR